MDDIKNSASYPFTLWERLVRQPGLGTQILIASLIIHLLDPRCSPWRLV
ncbi:MAG: hypothetical protein H7834_15040 [Magnetococcus sp. YQC-9]